MSILRRTSHLDDAAFAELWTNALADGVALAEHPHLQACVECRLRFASFSNWMQELRTEAAGEAEEVISPERLALQQAQIFRRLEAAERPARVIAFPRYSAGYVRQSPIRRWVAVAAAAGLITGLGLGQMFNFRFPTASPSGFSSDRITQTTPRSSPGPVALPAIASLNEAAMLTDLDEAATPRYETLRAYDTFTPRAADFVQPR